MFASLAHITKLVSERKWTRSSIWFNNEHRRRDQVSQEFYKLNHQNKGLDLVTAGSAKHITSRYYQLNSVHAIVGARLHKIDSGKIKDCTYCSESVTQTQEHLLLECRAWRCERGEI